MNELNYNNCHYMLKKSTNFNGAHVLSKQEQLLVFGGRVGTVCISTYRTDESICDNENCVSCRPRNN